MHTQSKKTFVTLSFTLAVLFLFSTTLNATEISGSNVKGGSLVIPKVGITDKATFFPITVDGLKMEVFAIKAKDGTIRSAFNTCQVCFNSGRGWYVQESDQMVCQNCGNRFNVDQIEIIKGGCNPIPITAEFKSDKGGNITISTKFIAQNIKFFKRWKK